MQRQVACSGEDRDEDSQRSYIRPPEGLCPESEHGQDCGSRNIEFNAELEQTRQHFVSISNRGTNLRFLQLQILQFVHCKGLVGSVEERSGKQPLQRLAEDVLIDQQSSK